MFATVAMFGGMNILLLWPASLIFQIRGRGQGCGSAVSLFPLLSLSGAGQTQQQSMTHLSSLALFTQLFCFILAGDKCFLTRNCCSQFREMAPSDSKHAKVNDMVFHSYK